MKNLLPFLLLLFSCSEVVIKPPTGIDEEIKVNFEKAKRGEHIIVGEHDSCFVRWNYNKGKITIENYQCRKPLEETLYLQDQMLKKLVKKLKNPFLIRGLDFNVRSFYELEMRAGLYAYRSEDWSHGLGATAKEGIDNEGFLLTYWKDNSEANKELEEVFHESCYALHLESVQQISVMRASGLPYYPVMRREKVKRRAKLPANYFLKFKVRPKFDTCFTDFLKNNPKAKIPRD